MGATGRIPNRSEDLARPRERKGGEYLTQSITKGVAKEATIPEPDENWHPIAKMLYASLAESGQSAFYQSSDWNFAYSLMDDLSYYKNGTKRSGQMLQSIYSAMTTLLITEGDRRRVKIELEAPTDPVDPPSLAIMSSYRDGLGLDESENE